MLNSKGLEAAELATRFWARVDVRGNDECWPWTGHVNAVHGYGQIQIGERGAAQSWRAHRLSYVVNHGPIPDGMVVMHACDNRACVNPHHLSLGTVADNNRDMHEKGRAVMPDLKGRLRDACKRGHPFDAENTIHSSGKRKCRICRDEANRARDRRKLK